MKNYAIVGGGRLARHFSEYFRLLEIPHTCWTRDRWSPFNTFGLPGAEQRLKETVRNADRVLLLVKDSAIATLLKQVTENFVQTPESALTGPLTRNDQQTITRNMDSLDGDPLQDLYAAFVRFYQYERKQDQAQERAQMEMAI